MVGWQSGRMNPDPRDKMEESEAPRPVAAASRAVARSRNRTITSLRRVSFTLLVSPFLCTSAYIPSFSSSFSFEISTLLQPDFFPGDVSKTIAVDHGQSRGPISPALSSRTSRVASTAAGDTRKGTRDRRRTK